MELGWMGALHPGVVKPGPAPGAFVVFELRIGAASRSAKCRFLSLFPVSRGTPGYGGGGGRGRLGSAALLAAAREAAAAYFRKSGYSIYIVAQA